MIAIVAVVPLLDSAKAETPGDTRDRILAETRVNAVFLEGPLGTFTPDGDPTTLEIVFLKKKADGPSRVTEDGEVVFLYKASEDQQQDLVQKAFEIRIARAAAGT